MLTAYKITHPMGQWISIFPRKPTYGNLTELYGTRAEWEPVSDAALGENTLPIVLENLENVTPCTTS